jgi:hypothetical protein
MGVDDPRLIVVVADVDYDGAILGRQMCARAPRATVIGCSTAGEFTDQAYGHGGVAAMALGPSVVVRSAAAMATFDQGVEVGIRAACAKLSKCFEPNLRDLDPDRHVGIVLFDGTSGREDEANDILAHMSPFLSFVGGSAGDHLEFAKTWVSCGSETRAEGAVIALLETNVPTSIVKTASFVNTGFRFLVTRADKRVVHEMNGKPAAQAYAEELGIDIQKIDENVLSRHPLAIVIDGDPWVRSPLLVTPARAMVFASRVHEGTELSLLAPGDILGDTRKALTRSRAFHPQGVRSGLFFNCAHRRLLLDALGQMSAYHSLFADHPSLGFHTYGESYLAHMNSTMVGVLFG